MKDESPLVSVVIPTYNRSTFVVKAVDSALNQIFTDYEIIVVDDGSTDCTKNNLKQYGDRIKYIYQNNSGVSAARNAGIAVSRGKWLALLDSDDEWKPDYLAEQIRHAHSISGLCMQSTNYCFTDINGISTTNFEINGALAAFRGTDYVLVKEPLAFILANWGFQVGSTIFLRDALVKAGLFDTKLNISEDLDLMARVSLQGPFGLLNKVLVNVYRRDESTECLTSRLKKDPLGVLETDSMIYQKLKLNEGLSYRERKSLNRGLSAKRRAMGNLLLQMGDKRGARDFYRRAVFIDPSIRSLGKYILSCLPTKADRS